MQYTPRDNLVSIWSGFLALGVDLLGSRGWIPSNLFCIRGFILRATSRITRLYIGLAEASLGRHVVNENRQALWTGSRRDSNHVTEQTESSKPWNEKSIIVPARQWTDGILFITFKDFFRIIASNWTNESIFEQTIADRRSLPLSSRLCESSMTLFPDVANWAAISLAASSRRSSRKPLFLRRDSPTSSADCASPWARTMID